MKIGIDFASLEDISNILWCIKNLNLQKVKDKKEFIFSDLNDTFIFVQNSMGTPSDSIKDCDIKIRAYHTFQEWKNMIGYDLLIQSQIVENYHIYNNDLKEFLDAGHIALSSASISFNHPNFYYEPLFNINYFYYFYGANYINFYKTKNDKINLIGTYHKEGGKSWRDEIFNNIKKDLGNDLISFKNNDYNLKNLYQPYSNEHEIGFNLWGLNHISTYIDYKMASCNLIFETMQHDGNNEEQDTRMFGRRYITEKTTKALLYCEEEIFFIWYGPQDIYEYLMKMGFWFYNSEFYKGDMKQSVYDASSELKKLKIELGNNNAVYDYLKQNYGHKLKSNVELFYKMLDCYYKKDEVLNLIKNAKRN
jgi:hypothetical protein